MNSLSYPMSFILMSPVKKLYMIQKLVPIYLQDFFLEWEARSVDSQHENGITVIIMTLVVAIYLKVSEGPWGSRHSLR